MRILLVDDDPLALKLLSRQLGNLGFSEVVARERAHDAIALLEAAPDAVDLIFCDLQMPGMDGVEFVRHLVRVGYSNGVVLVSGEDRRILDTAAKLAKAQALNVLGTIRKPVSPAGLGPLLRLETSAVHAPSRAARTTYGPDELRRAIVAGELVNHYQPKVEVASGRVAGVETLVRWSHPSNGLVFPDQFIRTAEENDLIDDLTRLVLINAMHQARRWRDAGLDLHVAVNVSMDNLADLEFPDFVRSSANEAGVALESMVLEVTESRLMNDPLSSLDILTRLRLKRIGLSIDDFGTGHSSLAQLRDVPFDELKVDRGFVHGAWQDASLRAIFEASLGMAHQLNMKTVAEGVEDQDDWDFLRRAGCDLAQGYFIAKPMPAENIEGWMIEWEARRPELVASTS